MELYTYIPITPILKATGLIKELESNIFAKGSIIVSPSVFNISKQFDFFDLQYNPENFKFSGGARYNVSSAKGTRDSLEYLAQDLDETTLFLILADDIKSQKGEDGQKAERPIPFDDINVAISYFTQLTKPTLTTNIPPTVSFGLGSISFIGVVKSYRVTILKTWADGSPKIASIELTIVGEVLV